MSRADRELDQWEREQRVFDNASVSEKINIVATRNTNAMLSELRFIRWLLLVLTGLAITAVFIWAPSGWWHTPFWAY